MANGQGFMQVAGSVLVVEDNPTERKVLAQLLRLHGLTVQTAESADKALSYVDEGIHVVLSDLHMAETDGIRLLELWKKRAPNTEFILVTGQSSIDSAVTAIKSGAFDYVVKPINPDEIVLLIKRAIELGHKDKELEHLRRRLDKKFGFDQIIGESKQMRDVFERVRRAAPVDSTVLVLGESGTGKELIAQALHQNSGRKGGPFVAVNCAAVPATLVESELFGHVKGAFTGATDRRIGRFEQAAGGTLFVDEIGDFELGLQAKLLRVLETFTVTPVGGAEDRKVDVRVVAATSRDLYTMVQKGQFREDLFYRLNVVQINLPPLRDRKDDIPILVERFLTDIATMKKTPNRRINGEVMRRFMGYRWPGNVRQLRNALESMMVLAQGDILTEADLPDRLLDGDLAAVSESTLSSNLTMDQIERLAILHALRDAKGNRTHAARRLGISVRTLQRKLRRYEADVSFTELLREPTPGVLT